MSTTTQSVQCFGKKKTATAVAHCKVRREPDQPCDLGGEPSPSTPIEGAYGHQEEECNTGEMNR